MNDKKSSQRPVPEKQSLKLRDIRQFVLERFEDVKSNSKMKELVQFHTVNKFLFMAHGPNELKELGNLVANHNDLPIFELFREYEIILRTILKKSPTIKSHSNTLYHISGHFSKILPSIEKQFLKRSIEDYVSGKISLSQILETLKFLTSKFDRTYLAKQTYFLLYTEPKFKRFGN